MSGNSNELGSFDLGLPDFSQPDSNPAEMHLDDSMLVDESMPASVSSKPSASGGPIPANPTPVASAELAVEESPKAAARGMFGSTVPSWLISMVVHVAVMLVLGAWNFEPITKELQIGRAHV